MTANGYEAIPRGGPAVRHPMAGTRSHSRFALLGAMLLATAACASFRPGANTDQGQPPDVRVVSAVDEGAIWSNPQIRGRDGGYSTLFNGKSYWFFGDTLLEKANANGERLLSNSWSNTSDLDAGDGIFGFQEPLDESGAPASFFPLTPGEEEFNRQHQIEDCKSAPCGARWVTWPGAAVVDKSRNRLLVFYSLVYAEPGNFNFYSVGSSIAVWNGADARAVRPQAASGADESGLLFKRGDPAFGAGVVLVGTMLYTFGPRSEGINKPCFLARVPVADSFDRNAWEFYAGGDDWTSSLDAAESVFDGNDMMSVSYNPYLDRLIAVYSRPSSREVVLRTAARPEGPWSREAKLFRAWKPDNEQGWVYDAIEHPEYARDGGREIYVTYSRQTGSLKGEIRIVRILLGKPEASRGVLPEAEAAPSVKSSTQTLEPQSEGL